MCGIYAAVFPNDSVVTALLSGLNYLSYRGYDSTGICLHHDHGLAISKALGTANSLSPTLTNARSGMGHSRWATHGKISIENAHPHSSHGQVAIVHNGIILNHLEIRSKLENEGYVFVSETDTEVIAHLLHSLLSSGLLPMAALTLAQKALSGRYAFAMMLAAHPSKVFAITSNLPLILGQSNKGTFIASDLTALQHCTVYARADNKTPFYIDGTSLPPGLKTLPIPKGLHFNIAPYSECRTLQEIFSQEHLPGRIDLHWSKLAPISLPSAPKAVLVIACGSSYHCGLVFKHWLFEAGIHCIVEVASELKEVSLPDLSETLIIAISQSGETADTLLSLEKMVKTPHLSSIAITNAPESSIAHACAHVIPILAGPEIGVASTKAVTGQLITLYRVLALLAPNTPPQPEILGDVLRASLQTPLKSVAATLVQYRHILCLGKRTLFPIAQELALKLKELTYIHAEAVASGELKHGPLALIDESVLCIALDDRDCPYIQTSISEIKARGGRVILITQAEGSPGADEVVHIPSCSGKLHILPMNVACQLLSYYAASILGRSIDTPRNLAKSVTVE